MDKKPTITSDMLVAFLDGEADVETQAYIEAHRQEFAEQLAMLQGADDELRERLRQFRPISTLELGQYQLGLSNSAERTRIADYLAQHPHAAHSLDMLDAFLSELDPGPAEAPANNLLTQARVFIGKLLGDGSPQAGLAMGLRGEQEGIYEAGGYQVIIENDTDFDDPSKLAITGLLTGVDDASGLVANLWHQARAAHIAAAELDEFGNFGFGGIEAGGYELIISGEHADFEIHIQALSVA